MISDLRGCAFLAPSWSRGSGGCERMEGEMIRRAAHNCKLLTTVLCRGTRPAPPGGRLLGEIFEGVNLRDNY